MAALITVLASTRPSEEQAAASGCSGKRTQVQACRRRSAFRNEMKRLGGSHQASSKGFGGGKSVWICRLMPERTTAIPAGVSLDLLE